MATFQFTIPDAILARVAEALRAKYPDLAPAGATPAAALSAIFRFVIRSTVVDYEVEKKRKEIQTATGDVATATWTATEGIG